MSRWYDERRCRLATCVPNPEHVALAGMQRHVVAGGKQFSLITQNVDRLHQTAGSTDVIELHGTILVWRCTRCGVEAEERGGKFATYPVPCACGGLRRPGVVWFGESLPPGALGAAQQAAASCDLFMSLGTSSVVYPAAGLIDLSLSNRADVLEINPQPTAYSASVSWSIRGKTGVILPKLLAAMHTSSN